MERKVKAQELNCLYVLTDYIDCGELADVCKANLAEVEEIMGVPVQEDVTNGQLENVVEQEIYVV